jgi:uncharacterized protein involved in type VI secretion and phage assembly
MSTAGDLAPGVAIGTVKSVDPALGRVKVFIHERGHPTHWAPVASAMSGKNRGAYLMPEVGDEVVIGFDRGQFDHPVVIGFLWNGKDAPPSTDRRVRIIRSVNGHEIAMYDPPPSEGDSGYIRIQDAHGNQIELSNGQISIRAIGALTLDAPVVTINGRPVSPIGPPI